MKSKGKLNYDIISYNLTTRNIVALNDCKHSMEDNDIKRVEDLLKQLAKPIVNKAELPFVASPVR